MTFGMSTLNIMLGILGIKIIKVDCQSGESGFPAKECVVKGTKVRILHPPPIRYIMNPELKKAFDKVTKYLDSLSVEELKQEICNIPEEDKIFQYNNYETLECVTVEVVVPEMPEGKYGVSVLVVQFDPTFEELSPGNGQSVSQVTYSKLFGKVKEDWYASNTKLEEDFLTIAYGGDENGWCHLPCMDEVTHWMCLPMIPEED